MSLTQLTARSIYDVDGCIKTILEVADGCDFETRPLAYALEVSYPTLLRVLDRLDLKEKMRELWIARRREKKAAGK